MQINNQFSHVGVRQFASSFGPHMPVARQANNQALTVGSVPFAPLAPLSLNGPQFAHVPVLNAGFGVQQTDGHIQAALKQLERQERFFDIKGLYNTSDDVLREWAVNSINFYFNENLMSLSAFHDLGNGMRLAQNTEQQRIDAAKLTAEQMGAALIFDRASIHDEISRALQVGSLMNIGFAQNPSALDFDVQLVNMAALYAFYEQKAEAFFSGEERKAVMQMLDAEFSAGLRTVMDFVTNNGTARYMQADMGGVRGSIAAIFEDYKDYYSGLLRGGSFSTGAAGTEFEWLDNTAIFVTAKLRNYADTRGDLQSASATYNVNDLQAMITMGQLSSVDTEIRPTNEQRIGMMLGMDAIALQMMIERGGLSDAAIRQLQGSFEMLKNEVIQNVNQKLVEQRMESQRRGGFYFDMLDTNAVDQAIAIMLEALDSKSLAEGLQKSVSKLLDIRAETQANQYVNGRVQDRYKDVFDINRPWDRAGATAVNSLLSGGLAWNHIQAMQMGLTDRHFGFNEALMLNTLALLFDQKDWLVPERLFAYEVIAFA